MRNKSLFSALIWLMATILLILGFTYIGPAEKILGSNIRIVYLHGAWVWTSLAAFVAAGACGLFGVISQTPSLQHWSRSLGRTGILFWITYLPISIWAMQTSWNGLYLAEPRFRLAIIFAVVGLLVQSGVTLLGNPAWASIANLVYVIWLILALVNTQNVMHPASPILRSNVWRIQVYFTALCVLTFLAAWQITRLGMQLESRPIPARKDP
jgi:hypothetical protein